MENEFWHPYCTRWAPTKKRLLRPPTPVPGLTMLGGSKKAVGHKTQSESQNPDALFKGTGFWPHFLLGPDVAYQFLPINLGAYALENAPGLVETNRGGKVVVQIEVVGFSGVTMHARTADRLVAVAKWLETKGVPWAWPSGRPVKAREIKKPGGRVEFVDAGGHNRNVKNWTSKDGWFDHGSVPENRHWDWALTDLEWWVLNEGMR